jgi:hypothetical protein
MMKNDIFLTKIVLSVIAGLVLAVGFEVSLENIGFLQFVATWLIGANIVSEGTTYLSRNTQRPR